jgi:predicted phosphoribosyltransferase
VAVPVAPEDSIEKIRDDADEIVVLRVPDCFVAIGQFYTSFGQVEDEEVEAILKKGTSEK